MCRLWTYYYNSIMDEICWRWFSSAKLLSFSFVRINIMIHSSQCTSGWISQSAKLHFLPADWKLLHSCSRIISIFLSFRLCECENYHQCYYAAEETRRRAKGNADQRWLHRYLGYSEFRIMFGKKGFFPSKLNSSIIFKEAYHLCSLGSRSLFDRPGWHMQGGHSPLLGIWPCPRYHRSTAHILMAVKYTHMVVSSS